jgi:hypothetical protein
MQKVKKESGVNKPKNVLGGQGEKGVGAKHAALRTTGIP